MKIALLFLAAVVAASSASQKRFLFSEHDVDMIIYQGHFDDAKEEFNSIIRGQPYTVSFDHALAAMMPSVEQVAGKYICNSWRCRNYPQNYLGSAAPLANRLCEPLCDAAVAKYLLDH